MRSQSSAEFEFPKICSFPPLYTKQPNQTVQQQQLESWNIVILQYCEFYKINTLTMEGVPKHSQISSINISDLPPLFHNKFISRQVNTEFKNLIITNLIRSKKADYINPKKPDMGLYIYWRSITEWGNLIYEYINETGQKGSVLTIYELTKNDDDDDDVLNNGLPSDLRNLEESLLIKVIREYLVKQGKAQLLMNENNEIGGVKIV
ncbi:uncharacterized protein KGF55_002319 [Candida pseudojiufengensis]|uniref:uncharacterized protein n=1 Tax=Candida pseudojiufengensis TaxID=497109 RepID=UPI002223EEE9|nr:uncharacterized protein KGF55_002319 [Candida pseudojiufengensis]KAI5964377.1 hypothetical protein KGF55_002319 [Candida pseudojiufengensis]